MKISELAHHTGVSIRSLRYYESKRLLKSSRLENGYRSFDKTAIERVRNIQFYLRLGLTADQIFQVVWCCRPDSSPSPLDNTNHRCCPEAVTLYKEKLAEIEKQIALLEKAKIHLKQRIACSMDAKEGFPNSR